MTFHACCVCASVVLYVWVEVVGGGLVGSLATYGDALKISAIAMFGAKQR